jgi:NAD(P)-dependent dehydrogenase (short-subunit alcohol dehydrogenase family)
VRQTRGPGHVDRPWRQRRIDRDDRVGRREGPGRSGTVPYEATKGALVTFARGLSNEVASEGIRSNSVSPGVIETDLAGPDLRDDLGKRAPLGRLGQPNENAATVSWLVSPEASFVTGSDITVSGGL